MPYSIVQSSSVGQAITANTTQYWIVQGRNNDLSTTETDQQIIYRQACTLSGFSIRVNSNNITGASTVNLRKNAADANQTVSVTASTNGTFTDNTNTDSIAAADKLCVKSVPGDTTHTFSISTITMLSTTDDATGAVSRLASTGSVTLNATGSINFLTPNGKITTGGVESTIKVRQQRGGIYKSLMINIISNARTTTTTFVSRKNAINANLSISIGTTTTGFFEDTTNSDTVQAGDDYCGQITLGASSENITATTTAISFIDTLTLAGVCEIAVPAGLTDNASLTKYFAIGGDLADSNTETDEAVAMRQPFRFSFLSISVSSNSVSAASTLTFRKNLANGIQSVSITSSTTGVFVDSVSTDVDTIAVGDTVDYQLVTGGSGTSLTSKWIAAWILNPTPPVTPGAYTVTQSASFGTNTTANTTQFWPIIGQTNPSATETDIQVIFREACTLSFMSVVITGNSVAGVSTMTLRKNAADAGQSVSIGSSATGTFTDSVNSDSIVATDKLSAKTVPGASTGVFGVSTFTMLMTTGYATGAVTRHAAISSSSQTTNNSTNFIALQGNVNLTSPESNVQLTQKYGGTYQNMFMNISANARTTAGTFTSRKNTAAGTMTVSVGAAVTGFFEDTTHTDAVIVGDLYNLAFTFGASAENITFVGVGVSFVDTNGMIGQCNSGRGGGLGFTANTTNYAGFASTLNVNSTESPYMTAVMRKPFKFKFLSTNVTANTVTAASTINFRKNLTNGQETVSITASTTGVFVDSTGSDSIAAGDKVDYQVIAGTTGTSVTLRYIATWIKLLIPTTVWIEWEES